MQNDAQTYLTRGLQRFDNGDLDGAITDYSEAIRLKPDFFAAWGNRGNAWRVKGEYDKAIADYSEVIRLQPNDGKAWNNRGSIWHAKGNHDKAITDCNEAIRLQPDNAAAWGNRGSAWSMKGDYDRAIADHSEAIRLRPGDAATWYNRGNAWSSKGEYDKAIADYDEAIRLKPDFFAAWGNRGNARREKGGYDKAITDYSEIIRLQPDDVAAWYNRGNTWSLKGEYDKAISDYNEAIRLKPDFFTPWIGRGNAWNIKGEYDKAIADYSEAIRLQPDNAAAWNNRGNAWSDKGEHSKAIDDYSEAIRLEPNSFAAWDNRGNARRAKGEYDEAIADHSKAIRLQPGLAIVWNKRGLTWYAKGEYQKAIADYDEAIRLQPVFQEAIRNRAAALRAMENTPIAPPEHTSDAILDDLRAIQEATPLAERIEWIPATRKIRIKPVPMRNTNLWNVILGKLRDEIADIQNKPAISNTHCALIPHIGRLQSTLERYADSPQRIHDEIERTLAATQMLVDESAISDDIVTKLFKKTLTDCVLDIRGDISKVRIVVEKRAALRFAQLPIGDRDTLQSVTNEVIPYIEEPRIQEDMQQDAQALTDDRDITDAPEKTIQIYRWASRMSRMLGIPEIPELLHPKLESLRKKVPDISEKVTIAAITNLILRSLGLFP